MPDTVVDWSKVGALAAPPHELNVRKFAESRASELEGLHSVIAGRLDNNFRSQRNKRKRTTGHDNRVAKKKFKNRGSVEGGGKAKTKDDSLGKDAKKISRRVRRSLQLRKNPASGFVTSGDGTKRLRTHVWHAKRFTMTKLWGFHLPLGYHGRGRGSRALLKKLKHGVLVHDASYHGSVQLEGPQDVLLSILSSVLVPLPSACGEEISHDILAGNIYGTAMLHRADKPCSPPIAPVTYMWRPVQPLTNSTEGTMDRQLWVWIHAAAFKEAYNTLSFACERQVDMGRSAHCVSLEGQLATLELIGSKVLQLLQKTLLPANCLQGSSEKLWHLKKCLADEHDGHEESGKTTILENGNEISSSAVISMVVMDPRALTEKGNVFVPEGKSLGLLTLENCQSKDQHEAECVWDASIGICPPVEESVFCNEKHGQRKEFICLGHKSSRSRNGSVDGKDSRVCSVLLLKYENHGDSVERYSIILPLCWVRAFWITLLSNGAHAIGLREKHWVASEIGLPYFPFDFPDCSAYSHFMAIEAVEFNNRATLRPRSKRPPQVPIPPPWNCVHLTIEEENSRGHGERIDNMKNGSGCGKSQTIIVEDFIARTSSMLSDFLNDIYGNHLLLLPRTLNHKDSFYKLMKDMEFPKQHTILSKVKCGQSRCFIRVLLRACKKGAFEQGAVVCAPQATDILSWRTRSEIDDGTLEIPQSTVDSYFRQSPSGEWELNIPADAALCESYRWPIGFITTGFVRGSNKPMAGAFVEASLLSRLREEQWKALPVRQRRKEIYVLVRNMKSTVYRLALATIVLEQMVEDLKFI